MRTPLSAVAVAESLSQHKVQDLADRVGLCVPEREKLRAGGLEEIPVADVGPVELVGEVLQSLRGHGWRPEGCHWVGFAHSLELTDEVLAELSDRLRAELPALRRVPLMLTGRPCSVLHFAIELATHQYWAEPDGTALVIGADVAPSVDERFFFGSAMGDAAVGLVVGGSGAFGEILACHSTWLIIASDGAASDPEDISRFRAQNPTAIRATIAEALRRADLSWGDLAAIVPHTPYRQIWDTVAELCRYPRERILDDGVARTGHLNSNDVVVHLAEATRTGRIRAGDVVALVSPGFGGTRGCTVVRYGRDRST